MNPEQVDGRVRLALVGRGRRSRASCRCSACRPPMPAVEVSMNVPGSEIAMDCDDARVFCQAQGSNLNLSGFFRLARSRRTAPSLGTQALPFLPTFTAAFAYRGSRRSCGYNCSVYNLMSPAVNLHTGGVAVAKAF